MRKQTQYMTRFPKLGSIDKLMEKGKTKRNAGAANKGTKKNKNTGEIIKGTN